MAVYREWRREVKPKKLIILINDEKLNEGKTNFT